MKTLTFVLLSFCWLVSNAAIWRVNSNLQINASFNSLQDAINSALVHNNDTLYLENGSFFGTINLTKNLVIIGPGYFLTENDSTYANPLPAVITSLTLGNGCAGSKMTGISVNEFVMFGNGSNNIILERSKVGKIIYAGDGSTSTGVTIRECYIVSGIDCSSFLSVSIYNNIITGYVNLTALTGSQSISNNVIYFNDYYNSFALFASNASVFNNIIIRQPANRAEYCVNFSATNSTYDRNLMTQSVNPAFPDNLYGIVMENVFTCLGSTEEKWKLVTGSPATGYGLNGYDCGAYDGPMPYVPSGLPFQVPRIFKATIPFSGNGSVIPVHITAKTQEE